MGTPSKTHDHSLAVSSVPPAWTESPAVAPETASEPARILVVEDDHLVALDIQRHLEEMGHTVDVVHNANDAVGHASASSFDAVLMDIKLGDQVDGIDAAHTIRRIQDLPIIYLTAYADNRTLERARQTEPYGYILKPFQERELKATIEMALQRHVTDARRWEQQEIQRFLAEASSILAATLDYRSVALGAAELMVPRYADWCTIQLQERSESVPAFAVTRPNGTGLHDADGPEAPMLESVLHSGQPELYSHIDDVESLRNSLGPRHFEVLRSIGARSLLCVPLLARSKVVGALALASGRVRERFGADQLAFAEDFAHRLAMALDNALLYREAERALEMRDDVLAIVSHDLRTPLGVIQMQAEMLSDDEQLAKVGASIEQAAHQMNRLIGDLLDASAINAGRLTLELGRHHPRDILRETAEMFQAQAQARSLELIVECAADLPAIQCDAERIVQVLSNLVTNAIKATPRGGTICIRARAELGQVRFEVDDTGRGIPVDQVPFLFDRFWRAHGKRGGAGLGLFIARGIVAAHGGSLGVETEVGEGSCFFFSLPTE